MTNKTMSAVASYKYYESNAGHITCAIFNSRGELLYTYTTSNIDYAQLRYETNALKKDSWAYESWEGDALDTYCDSEMQANCKLVADEHGIYPGSMGINARDGFALDN